MGTWLEDIIVAFKNLNGVSNYEQIYEEVKRIRDNTLPLSWKEIIRRTIETHSSDSQVFDGKNDLFYSVEGLGNGIWGLKEYKENYSYSNSEHFIKETVREETTYYRIIRDTKLALDMKRLYNYRCQICDFSVPLGENSYAEAHHIKPLGHPHNGPDTADNILVVCPNHHVQCDYGAIKLNLDKLHIIRNCNINPEYIEYHNNKIYKK